jgi:hypothetical protein
VKCESGAVTSISLKSNGLKGTWPKSIGNLAKLSSLVVEGTRPSSYTGCVDSDFGYSDFPASFWTLKNLVTFNAENACLGGSLVDGTPGIGAMTKLSEFSIHQVCACAACIHGICASVFILCERSPR